MGEATYKRIFFIGALWNLLGGVFIVAATGWIFATAGVAEPSPPAYYYGWIALFMTFGLGYYLVYRDMYRNRDIALLGAIGKVAFAAVFLYDFFAYPHQVPAFFLVPVAGDLVFAALFVMFLRFAAGKEGP
jgi:peptidoglycan/LPS O-acetylase OafA/YrhL